LHGRRRICAARVGLKFCRARRELRKWAALSRGYFAGAVNVGCSVYRNGCGCVRPRPF